MIFKILTHLSFSLPPRTNLYANLHLIMLPHNMVIAVMFSREEKKKKKKLSRASISEVCIREDLGPNSKLRAWVHVGALPHPGQRENSLEKLEMFS